MRVEILNGTQIKEALIDFSLKNYKTAKIKLIKMNIKTQNVVDF